VISVLAKPVKGFIRLNEKTSENFNSLLPNLYKSHRLYDTLYKEVSASFNKNVCEIGGIDRPMFTKDKFSQYDGLDIDYNERVHELYHNFFHTSIEDAKFTSKYDCMFSQYLVEHVEHKKEMFTHIYNSLEKGGRTTHIFPGANHPYSLLNIMLGPTTRKKLLKFFIPSYVGLIGYKPFYKNCSYSKIKKLLLEVGYSRVEIQYEFSGINYFKAFLPVYMLILLYNYICYKLNLKNLASNYLIIAYK
jgi:hypothetical protein